jgi:preprotein translocase subunit SecF
MGKRQIHHILVRLRGARLAYFVIVFVLCAVVFAFSYRHNNLTALYLRDRLIQIDKDNGDVKAALNTLRQYTYSHMNADLSSGGGIYPPIQLKYTYDRLVQAQKAGVDAANSTLYTDAQNYCEGRIKSRLTTERVPCIQDYLATHSAPAPQSIPDGLYKFDFVAPTWSPDLAGWSLVAMIIAFISLVTRIALEFWLRYRLRS